MQIEKSDFSQFFLVKFFDLGVLSVARQFYTNVYSEDFNANISLLSQKTKAMSLLTNLI